MHKLLLSALLLVLAAVLFQSCAVKTITRDYSNEETAITRPGILAVYMDGTANKPQKKKKYHLNTHIIKLLELQHPGYRSYYLAGVGTDRKIMGMAIGAGTRKRVVRAYLFLSRHYKVNDSICLFGFSRGANQCRILSNLVYTFGILDLSAVKSHKAKRKLVKQCYDLYRVDATATERRRRVALFTDSGWSLKHPRQPVKSDTSGNTKITVMGLWDTVEAFVLNSEEEIYPVKEDLNQVLNSKKIFHAVSLDDNRANIYTPILLNTKYVDAGSLAGLREIAEEVWFSGSHRDVGGGPKDQPELSKVSLKWMLERSRPYNLFRDTLINTVPNAYVHEGGEKIFRVIRKNRSIGDYYTSLPDTGWKLMIHRSVINRLHDGKTPDFKTREGMPDWFDMPPFKHCFDSIGRQRILKPGCPCIKVVD